MGRQWAVNNNWYSEEDLPAVRKVTTHPKWSSDPTSCYLVVQAQVEKSAGVCVYLSVCLRLRTVTLN